MPTPKVMTVKTTLVWQGECGRGVIEMCLKACCAKCSRKEIESLTKDAIRAVFVDEVKDVI